MEYSPGTFDKKVFFHFLKRLYQDESAQSTVEYLLILSVIMFGASQVARRMIFTLDKVILRIGGDLERDLKTGRVNIGIWKN